MKKKSFRFATGSTDLLLEGAFSDLKHITDPRKAILITDEHVHAHHSKKFRNWNTIVLKAGEEFKIQPTADAVIGQLVDMGADRTSTLIGIGGGVVTDLTGYIAAIYMRGAACGFVPTSLLCMVDASIGGKNGINSGIYKNLVGTIRQPAFILHDTSLLRTLPDKEWNNGFAEIIKHAAILDPRMFTWLEEKKQAFFRTKSRELNELIARNALLKMKLVQDDEFEKGKRRILNFGHTIGHALEKQYDLSHGEAISIGMTYACQLSSVLTGFRQTDRVTALLEKYGLPSYAEFDRNKIFRAMKGDKKKAGDKLHFVLLEKIGKSIVRPIEFQKLEELI